MTTNSYVKNISITKLISLTRVTFFLFIFLLYLLPVVGNAETITYNVCKNGCEYSEVTGVLIELQDRENNYNNDDITINITDTSDYYIDNSKIEINYDENTLANINSFTINGNNSTWIFGNGNRNEIYIGAKNILVDKVKVKDYFNLGENWELSYKGNFFLMSDSLHVSNSDIGEIINEKKAGTSNIDNCRTYEYGSFGNSYINNSEMGIIFIPNDSFNNLYQFNMENVKISLVMMLFGVNGTINNSHFKGLTSQNSIINIQNSEGKVYNFSFGDYDSIVNIYNPINKGTSYFNISSLEEYNNYTPQENEPPLYGEETGMIVDKWGYDYANITVGNKTAKINIYYDDYASIKVDENINFKKYFDTIENDTILTYVIDDSSIAKENNGIVTALKEGTTNITATREDGLVIYRIKLTVIKQTIAEKIDEMTIKVPKTGMEIKAWVLVVTYVLIKKEKMSK